MTPQTPHSKFGPKISSIHSFLKYAIFVKKTNEQTKPKKTRDSKDISMKNFEDFSFERPLIKNRPDVLHK